MIPSEQSLSALIDLIYDATLEPELWGEVADRLEAQTRGRVAFLLQQDRPTGFFRGCSEAGDADIAEYLDRHWRTDLAMKRLRSAPVGASVADSQLVSDAGRDQLEFYREYLRPRGLHRGYYTVLYREGPQSTVMGVHRPDKDDDFSEACAQSINVIRPHLSRSLALSRRLAATNAARDASLSALEQAGLGLVVLGRNAAVRFANASGEELLRSGALRVASGRCEATTQSDTRALHAAVTKAVSDKDAISSTLTLSRPGSRHPVRVTVTPLRPNGRAGLGSEPLAMLVFGETAPELNDNQLRREYGLTTSESRLLKALVTGERLADYAERVGVRVTTAKTHLSSVFAKTGEQRQADLVRLALTDPSLRLQLDRAA
jgi:DNA-binding NarL/FixJ family response regulator